MENENVPFESRRIWNEFCDSDKIESNVLETVWAICNWSSQFYLYDFAVFENKNSSSN